MDEEQLDWSAFMKKYSEPIWNTYVDDNGEIHTQRIMRPTYTDMDGNVYQSKRTVVNEPVSEDAYLLDSEPEIQRMTIVDFGGGIFELSEDDLKPTVGEDDDAEWVDPI